MRILLLVAAIAAFSVGAFAQDKITLSNGDVITGKITSMAGGKVTIFGDDYPMSLPAEPEDRDETGTISVDLIGQGVSRFRATLGGDYPVGGDDIHRKIIATRATGSEARFLSAIELHEDDPVIKRITAESATRIVVERHDGQTDTLEITGLDGDGSAAVRMSVEKAGKVVATENTGQ